MKIKDKEIPKEIKAFCFDFDGVIGKTTEDNYNAWCFALQKHGLSLASEDYYKMEGRKSSEVATYLLKRESMNPALAEQIVADKDKFYEQTNTFSLYPGVSELLAKLKQKNFKLALVSGGSKGRLERTNIPKVWAQFDVIVTGEDCSKGKPAPEPYLKAAEKLKLPANVCLVVENAPLGIESAKKAGMRCIAITTTLKEDVLRNADCIIPRLTDLLEWQ